MQHLSVVIAQKDHAAAQRLAHHLHGRFHQVVIARSAADIEEALLKSRAHALIVDLELIASEELRRLCQNFSRTAIVATHRSPDEEMWMTCLELGAVDCCQDSDVPGMLRAIGQNVVLTRAAHAA